MMVAITERNKEEILTVTSRDIAEDFGKRHADVLESIRTVSDQFDSTENSVQYFIETAYKDLSGKKNKEYLLTRDGFSLLVMGFTGSEALQWKRSLSGYMKNERNGRLNDKRG